MLHFFSRLLILCEYVCVEGYCSSPVRVCVYVCVCVWGGSVGSFLPPRASRPRNIDMYVFTDLEDSIARIHWSPSFNMHTVIVTRLSLRRISGHGCDMEKLL